MLVKLLWDIITWEQYWCTMNFSKHNSVQTDFPSAKHISSLMPNYGTNKRGAWEGSFVMYSLVIM